MAPREGGGSLASFFGRDVPHGEDSYSNTHFRRNHHTFPHESENEQNTTELQAVLQRAPTLLCKGINATHWGGNPLQIHRPTINLC